MFEIWLEVNFKNEINISRNIYNRRNKVNTAIAKKYRRGMLLIPDDSKYILPLNDVHKTCLEDHQHTKTKLNCCFPITVTRVLAVTHLCAKLGLKAPFSE